MISNTSKYAIRALIYLELYSSKEQKKGIKVIAGELDIPSPFLGKILQMLVKQQLLGSTKGPHGGFFLNKSAIDIPVMEIRGSKIEPEEITQQVTGIYIVDHVVQVHIDRHGAREAVFIGRPGLASHNHG